MRRWNPGEAGLWEGMGKCERDPGGQLEVGHGSQREALLGEEGLKGSWIGDWQQDMDLVVNPLSRLSVGWRRVWGGGGALPGVSPRSN